MQREVARDGIVVEAEVGDGGEELAVRLHFDQRTNGDHAFEVWVIFEDLLEIVRPAGRNFEVAENRSVIARPESEREGRERAESLKNVALPVNNSAAKSGVEEMFLRHAPGEKFLRLILSGFDEQALGDSVFDLVGVRECGVGIEPDKIRKIVNAGDVAVGNFRLDGMFIPFAGPVLF